MSDEIVKEIVETRIQDNWVLTDVDYENIRYNPKRGIPFITPIINGDGVEKRGLNCKREDYTVLIEIRVQKNTGTALIASYAKQLKELFEGYTEGNFYCVKGYTQNIGNQGQWYQRNVVLTCRYKQTT